MFAVQGTQDCVRTALRGVQETSVVTGFKRVAISQNHKLLISLFKVHHLSQFMQNRRLRHYRVRILTCNSPDLPIQSIPENGKINRKGKVKIFRFTKAELLGLPAAGEGRRIEYADSVVDGLRLRVTSSGNKSFCVTRRRDGKFFRVTLGKFPDMTREAAYSALNEMAQTRRNPNWEKYPAASKRQRCEN
ncbi:Arm DNA-binding domain-containing protein [Enterobacter mori]|uniref:Arm DNA-binding domain-containing protein n=1 Tax=Enterobacter mori TaxID=539813 RepID=UPI003B83F090